MGDCARELMEEVKEIQKSIKTFSQRAEGLSDKEILALAKDLVYDIKDMIEKKTIIKENLEYEMLHG